MFNRIKSRLRRFRRDEDGVIVVEAMIMFPTLMAAVLATFVFFDAFRNQAINLKANYTIAESLSRQEEYITNVYMINMWNLHRFLTNSRHLTNLRVSVISYDADEDEHLVVWSRVKGGGSSHDDSPITAIGLSADDIPIMPNDEILIVVQTQVEYEPQFSIGLGRFTFANTTYTRSRATPDNVCYNHVATNEGGRICPIGN